jgi:hypothetical protein
MKGGIMRKLALLIVIAACIAGCNSTPRRVQESKEQPKEQPRLTPTEIFDLRTKCTELTDRMQKEG